MVIANKALVADTFWLRFKGLMFSKSLGEDKDGVFFDNCRSIQTTFMRYPIDVIFLNKENEVVKIIKEMKPWRMTPPYFKASKCLELMGGSLPKELVPGDKLEVRCIS